MLPRSRQLHTPPTGDSHDDLHVLITFRKPYEFELNKFHSEQQSPFEERNNPMTVIEERHEERGGEGTILLPWRVSPGKPCTIRKSVEGLKFFPAPGLRQCCCLNGFRREKPRTIQKSFRGVQLFPAPGLRRGDGFGIWMFFRYLRVPLDCRIPSPSSRRRPGSRKRTAAAICIEIGTSQLKATVLPAFAGEMI